jgi:hypothetical protein
MFGLLQQSHVNISGIFRSLVRHLEQSAGQTISLTEKVKQLIELLLCV